MTAVADAPRAVYCLPQEGQTQAPSSLEARASIASDERMLVENAKWFCALRWLVALALAALGVLGPMASGMLPLDGIRVKPAWPLAVSVALIALNVAYLAMLRRAAGSPRGPSLVLRCLWLQILFDLAVLTVVVHGMGSLESYAPFMYLFHIVLACIFFRYDQSLVVMLSAMGMYLGCLVVEGAGLLAPRPILAGTWAPERSTMSLPVMVWHGGLLVFISGTVWYLTSRLANVLWQREDELAKTNRRLVAATEERAKHMLRTTHQMKAPFAAIHANTQLLLGGYCGNLAAGAVAVVEQIAARCEMLSREIKEMLQLANLRSSAQSAPRQGQLDLAALVQSCLAGLRAAATERGVILEEELHPAPVCAVQDHAVMIVENIVSNAINYSHSGGKVVVSCQPKPEGGARVCVEDQGIGIPADKLPRIFDDYFRTNEAARHNRASTGLGLAIVRQAALAGRVDVRVESAPGQGTTVSLDFPAATASHDTNH